MKFKRITVDLNPIFIKKIEEFSKNKGVSFNSAIHYILYDFFFKFKIGE